MDLSLFEEPEPNEHARVFLAKYQELDAYLVTRGWPATSPWWMSIIGQFYKSGKRQLVDRVGRRGGKSSTLCRIAVVEALYGKHAVPPGDTGFIAFISHSKEEASQRLETIKAILNALGVAFREDTQERAIYLKGRPVAFKVYTATIAGVSGFTGILIVCDEVTKWRDKDTGANPATIVLTSVRPTLATQKNAKMILSSSAFSTMDAHYDAFEQGDTDLQMTAYAPTWLANPTVSEKETHQLEPDAHAWEREYKAIPQAETEESLLTQFSVDRCIRTDEKLVSKGWAQFCEEHGIEGAIEPSPYHDYAASMDPATRGHRWPLVIFTRDGQLVNKTVIVGARYWQGNRKEPLSPRRVLSEILPILKAYRIECVYTDQWHGDSLRDFAYELGINLVDIPATHAENMRLFENLKSRVDEREVELPNNPDMIQDLLNVRKRVTRSGFSIELPEIGGRHCDYAPCIARAASTPLQAPTSPPPTHGSEEWEEAMRERRRQDYLKDQKPQTWSEGVRARFQVANPRLAGSRVR